MKEMVVLNRKEQRRLVALNQVERGKVIGREATKLLDLSLRHIRRLLAAYRKEGTAALAHGNRGRKSPLCPALQQLRPLLTWTLSKVSGRMG